MSKIKGKFVNLDSNTLEVDGDNIKIKDDAELKKPIISQTTSVDSKGSILYHSLDSNYIDLSSNTSLDSNLYDTNNGTMSNFSRNDGTVSGGVTISDGAMVFNGVDGRITNINSNVLSEFTVSMWFKSEDSNTDVRVSLIGDDPINDNFLGFSSNDGLRGEFSDGTGFYNFMGLTYNTWYHVSYVYDGTDMVMYLNGVRYADSGSLDLSGKNMSFNYLAYGYSGIYFDGSIDNVQIFNEALTESQITTIYNAGRDSYSPISDGLVAQYSGKDYAGTENSPTTIYDTNMIVAGHSAEVSALKFDGVDDGILINKNMATNKPKLTVSTWIKVNSFDNSNPMFIFSDEKEIDNRFFLEVGTDEKIISRYYYLGTFYDAPASSVITEDVWYNVISVFNSDSLKIYLDGILQSNTSTSSMSVGSSGFSSIGSDSTGLNNNFSGSISNVLIYDRALTQDEIKALYNRDKQYFTDNNPAGRFGDFNVKGDLGVIGTSLITNDTTSNALSVQQDGNGIALNIDSEATTNPGLVIDIPAGDAHLRLVGDSGNASPTEGDLWRESTGLMYYDGTTEYNLIAGSGTVTSVAVSGSDGIEIDSGSPINTSGTIALGVNKTSMLTHLNVEDGADVTDTTNVTAAGALMDSELTDITAVKALNQGVATTDNPSFLGLTVGDGGNFKFNGNSDGIQKYFYIMRDGNEGESLRINVDDNTVYIRSMQDEIDFGSFIFQAEAGSGWGGYYAYKFNIDADGTETTTLQINVDGTVQLATGTSINEFSTDGTLAGNSDNAVPTEKAVKTYVDNNSGSGTVTSVAVSGSDGIEIDSGSPINTSGTIALGVNKTSMLTHLNVEDGADVTDTTNVTAAGALMDSELTDITAVKALNQGVATTDSPTFANINIADKINHSGDVDTYIEFGSDAIFIEVSGKRAIQITHGSTDSLTLGIDMDEVNFDVAGTERMSLTSTVLTSTVDFDMSNNSIQNIQLAEFNGEYDNGNSSTADTIAWNNGNMQKSTLTGNCTYTFTAPSGSCRLQLKLIQDATGSRTVTWPATVKWAGGSAPTLTTTASGYDIITFVYDGTNYNGVESLNFG